MTTWAASAEEGRPTSVGGGVVHPRGTRVPDRTDRTDRTGREGPGRTGRDREGPDRLEGTGPTGPDGRNRTGPVGQRLRTGSAVDARIPAPGQSWLTFARAFASPLAHSWFTRARSVALGVAFVQDVPGPPPDISSLHGPE